MLMFFILLFIIVIICFKFLSNLFFFTLIRNCYLYTKFHIYRYKLSRTINNAGEIESMRVQFFKFLLLALSLVAFIFESYNANNENVSDVNTKIYILGVKYITPDGNL